MTFIPENGTNNMASMSPDKCTVDLLFKTELHDEELRGKKSLLLQMLQEWKKNGIDLPLFYHPILHLIIVRLDETVPIPLAKKFFKEVKEIDYEFEVYIKPKEDEYVEF